MSNRETQYVIIGRVGSTYGVHGWLKVLSFTDMTTDIMNYNPWYLQDAANWTEIEIEDARLHGKGVIVKLAGWNTPEEARLLSGKNIAILRSQLPALADDEYYWNDLIGLTVIDQFNKPLGKVIYLMETGSNDVLVVKNEKEFAIPYLVGDVIKSVDLKEGVIHVNWDVI